MAKALMQCKTISLNKKQKCANVDSIHKEIIKTIDFKDTNKDDLQDRINILSINEKLK